MQRDFTVPTAERDELDLVAVEGRLMMCFGSPWPDFHGPNSNCCLRLQSHNVGQMCPAGVHTSILRLLDYSLSTIVPYYTQPNELECPKFRKRVRTVWRAGAGHPWSILFFLAHLLLTPYYLLDPMQRNVRVLINFPLGTRLSHNFPHS